MAISPIGNVGTAVIQNQPDTVVSSVAAVNQKASQSTLQTRQAVQQSGQAEQSGSAGVRQQNGLDGLPAGSGNVSNSEDANQDIGKAVDTMNDFLKAFNQNLQFSIDDDTQLRVIKLVDTGTKEVIRQIPSEEMLTIAKALDKFKGLLIQEQA